MFEAKNILTLFYKNFTERQGHSWGRICLWITILIEADFKRPIIFLK